MNSNNGNIEEGCIARVVNSELGNNDKIVTVVELIPIEPTYINDKLCKEVWAIDIAVKVVQKGMTNYINELPEFMLQRIDDGNLTEEELEAEEELVLTGENEYD